MRVEVWNLGVLLAVVLALLTIIYSKAYAVGQG